MNAPRKRGPQLTRRQFLIAAGAGGAAGVAAVGSQVVPTSPAKPGADKRAGKGYAESAHIRNYYRTTKI